MVVLPRSGAVQRQALGHRRVLQRHGAPPAPSDSVVHVMDASPFTKMSSEDGPSIGLGGAAPSPVAVSKCESSMRNGS